jgi:uncharacterized protein
MNHHGIPVRRMPFKVPEAEGFHPLYIAGHPVASYQVTGLGLYVALLEPFIVKSVRRVLDRITDPALREAADRFCRQEAQHYQQHERFNALIFGAGYPGLRERYEALREDFDEFLANRDDRFRIGFVEGFEANTTQGALQLVNSGVLRHPQTDKALGALWEWHMLEEIEHRHVAFDLYEHLFGGWLYRARMCWVAQHHMAKFIDDCTAIMMPVDVERHGPGCALRVQHRMLRLFMRAVPRIKSMLPTYTPHNYVLPASVEKLSAKLSSQATSVS